MDEPIRYYECSLDATLADLVNLYPADFSINSENSMVSWVNCRLGYLDDDLNTCYFAPSTAVKDIVCAYEGGNVGAPIYFSLIQK